MQLKGTVYVSQLPASEDQKNYKEKTMNNSLFLKV